MRVDGVRVRVRGDEYGGRHLVDETIDRLLESFPGKSLGRKGVKEE